MNFEREESLIPIGSIVYGGLASLLVMVILAVFLTVFIELGWFATVVTWPNNNLYLLILYIAIISGSVMAGWRSHEKGWAVGSGAGILSSVILVMLALFLHVRVDFGIFIVKVLITTFIGAFGGIIGVNLAGNKA